MRSSSPPGLLHHLRLPVFSSHRQELARALNVSFCTCTTFATLPYPSLVNAHPKQPHRQIESVTMGTASRSLQRSPDEALSSGIPRFSVSGAAGTDILLSFLPRYSHLSRRVH